MVPLFLAATCPQQVGCTRHIRRNGCQWYCEGDGKESFSRLSAYRGIEAPHRDVHAHGRKAVERFYAQDFDSAVRSAEAMESASRIVLQELESLAQEGETGRD